jgi:hypothetical protein
MKSVTSRHNSAEKRQIWYQSEGRSFRGGRSGVANFPVTVRRMVNQVMGDSFKESWGRKE